MVGFGFLWGLLLWVLWRYRIGFVVELYTNTLVIMLLGCFVIMMCLVVSIVEMVL